MPDNTTYTIELNPAAMGISAPIGNNPERPYYIARSKMDADGNIGLDVEGEWVIVLYYDADPEMKPFLIGKNADMDNGGTLVIKDQGHIIATYEMSDFPPDVNLGKEGGKSWLEIIEAITKENAERALAIGLDSALREGTAGHGKMIDDYIAPSLAGIIDSITEFDNPLIPNTVPTVPSMQGIAPRNFKI